MAKFEMNLTFREQLRSSPMYRRAMLEAGHRVADMAREAAPVHEGDYRDSIEVEPTARGVRVTAQDWKSGWLEYGTAGSEDHTATPAFAPLRKGVERAGLKLKAGRR